MESISEDESLLTNAKINVGVRMSPAEKGKIANDAAAMGMSVSEYCELVLVNRHEDKDESNQLQSKIEEQQQQMEALRKNLKQAGEQPGILSDKRLLWLFENLKDKKETVADANGSNFEIVYKTPREVLIAMIYSTKLNK